MSLRNASLPVIEKKPAGAVKRSPEEVADITRGRLDKQGWCLWQCALLDDEIIVIARDETVKGYPGGYPVYTEAELAEMITAKPETIRLIHVAKASGAVLIRGGK